MSNPAPHELIKLTCESCQNRFEEIVLDTPRQIECPICQHSLTVPSIAGAQTLQEKLAAARRQKQAASSAPEDAGYSLLSPIAEVAHEQLEKTAGMISLTCPVCQARLHAHAEAKPGQIECPDCHEPVRIPSRSEIRERKKKEAFTVTPDPIEPVGVGTPQVERRTYSSWYLDAYEYTAPEKEAPPPKSLYFSDTFNILWQPEVRPRWLYLVLGLTFCTLIGSVLYGLFLQGAPIAGLAMGFFALPLIWGGLWVASYAASVWMVIVTDTANGNPRITSWPDQNFRDWLMTLVYVEYLFGISAVIGYGVAKLAGLAELPHWPIFLTVSAITFPVIALSGLERSGSLNIFSPDVLRSLYRRPLDWLGYALIATLLTLCTTYLWWGMGSLSRLLSGLLGGVLWATFLLIQARMLGRLAWSISHHGLRKKKRKRKPSED